MGRTIALSLAIALFWPAGLAVASVVVDQCGTVVGNGQTAELPSDLDCSATAGMALTLGSGAQLRLNGFTIFGNPTANTADGVQCIEGCRIEGPGTITGFGGSGVTAQASAIVLDTTIQNNGVHGVHARHAMVFGSTITGNGRYGVYGDRSASVNRSSVVDNAIIGVLASGREEYGQPWEGVVVVTDSIISGSLTGVSASVLASVTRSTLESNSFAISSHHAIVDSTVIRNNWRGIDANGFHERPSVMVVGSLIEDNGSEAIYCRWDTPDFKPTGTVKIRDSVLRNNSGAATVAVAASIASTEIRGNGGGINATRVSVRDTVITGNGYGVRAPDSWNIPYYWLRGTVRMRDSTVSGNGRDGIAAESKASLRGGFVVDNCGSYTVESCADITTGRKPRIASTTCGTSREYGGAVDWDVCSLDTE